MRAKNLATEFIAREGLLIFTIVDQLDEVSIVHLTSKRRISHLARGVACQDVSQDNDAAFFGEERHMSHFRLADPVPAGTQGLDGGATRSLSGATHGTSGTVWGPGSGRALRPGTAFVRRPTA